MMDTKPLPQHIQEQIEKEAEAFAERTAERIYDVKEYWTTNDRIDGYINGATPYASKLVQAEDFIDKMAKAMSLVWFIISNGGDNKLQDDISVHTMNEILSEYENYKNNCNGESSKRS